MSLVAAPPDVLQWASRSQGHGDCAIAALALACGVSYENALAAALVIVPDVLTSGMSFGEMKRTAPNLGYTAKLKKKYDIEEDTGILSVHTPSNHDSAHVVYLWEGRIVEPKHDRQQLWLDPRAFLSFYKYETNGLLMMLRQWDKEKRHG